MSTHEKSSIQESIRNGTAPSIIKRRASRGTLPVSTDELLDILVFLTKDPDPTMSGEAETTLKSWTYDKCIPFLSHPERPAETLAYFAARDDLPEELVAALSHHANTDDATLAALAKRLKVPQIYELIPGRERALELPEFVKRVLERKDLPSDFERMLESALPKTPAGGAGPAAPGARKGEEHERVSITQKLQKMPISEKIAFATKANREAILILIRDPAKMVYRAALQSPKLGDAEAETISGMKNVSDEVLRALGANRKYLKNRAVIRNLANNPRTPIDISLTLLKRLSKAELKAVSANRNVADILRKTSTRMLKMKG